MKREKTCENKANKNSLEEHRKQKIQREINRQDIDQVDISLVKYKNW